MQLIRFVNLKAKKMVGTPNKGHKPIDALEVPPIYWWPPNPLKASKYLIVDLLFPYGWFYLFLALIFWFYLTPNKEQMIALNFSWILPIWLRNFLLLFAIAGGLHWLLYIKQNQGSVFKFNGSWLAVNNRRFLFKNQVRDNMFWSLISGVTIWTLYETLILWSFANEWCQIVRWDEAPIYLSLLAFSSFFWGTFHFWLVHRLLHWPPLYKIAHDLHHRNINVGPWSGISMHPIEHILYFSGLLIFFLVPAHPVLLIFLGFQYAILPAFSHSGFEKVVLFNKFTINVGNYFHQLHHKYFEVNYGNPLAPIDKILDTWHDGSDDAAKNFRSKQKKS